MTPILSAKPIKCLLLFCIAITASCSSIQLERFEDADQLVKFSSPSEALSFLEGRRKIANQIDTYARAKKPKKRSWLARLFGGEEQFVEEVQVFGIRSSLSNAQALQRMDGFSITNNQEANVDEGGLVKRSGDHLIVLRKGELFSVHVGSDIQKVDQIAVQPRGWEHGAWYDELLAYGNLLVVIGYGYDTGNTEYLFFEIDEHGRFSRKETYLVQSSDYFSDSNYAGRLVDGKLIFYINNLQQSPYNTNEALDITSFSPIVQRIDENGQVAHSYPLFESQDIYSPVVSSRYLNMTTVAICPLNTGAFVCTAKSILGGHLAEFYASEEAFYFWMRGPEWNIDYENMTQSQLKRYAYSDDYDHWPRDKVSAIYKIPFNSEAVGVVKIQGKPIDQFSFKETEESLNLVSIKRDFKKNWYEQTEEDAFLLKIPLSDFDRGVYELPSQGYTKIARDVRGDYSNRFVGNKLVYTDSIYRNEHVYSDVYILDTNTPNNITQITENFEVLQLHPIGRDLLLIASDNYEATQYHTLKLDEPPFIADTYAEPNSELAESRSHAFFYKPMEEGGIFAVPAVTELEDSDKKVNGIYYIAEGVTDMLYTRVDNELKLYPAGVLEGDKTVVWQNENECGYSCVDWYGSSRPVFWGDRIFALLKYELVEGLQVGGVVEELRRIDIRE